MRIPFAVVATVAVLQLATIPSAISAQAPDSTLQRPTEIILTVSNDPHLSGVFKSSAVSTKCGLADYGYPHRRRSFAVEFPYDATVTGLEVSSLSFDADTLVKGTTTNSFYLNVNLDTPKVGRPPALVVRAKEEPKYGEPGTATLVSVHGTDSLKIVGTATRGTKVKLVMTIVCQPRP